MERSTERSRGAERTTASSRVGSTDPEAEDFLAENTMKAASVGETRVAVVRTSTGVYAVDNACPHQGYGLVTGALDVDESGEALLTCQWHNWKFRATDGSCILGEEDVPCHSVQVAGDGAIKVTVTPPSDIEERERLWPSLSRGLVNHYTGQMSRDTTRLLRAGATPAQVMAHALATTLARTEDGLGHELALAADCLSLAESADGSDRVLPLVQGLAGLAETTRGRPEVLAPTGPSEAHSLVGLIEGEDLAGAMAAAKALALHGTRAEAGRAFIGAASAHHLGYGHGIIYTQKSMEMLDRIGWEHAAVVLPQLARSLTLQTREDTLPYMAKAVRALADIDFDALAEPPCGQSGRSTDQHHRWVEQVLGEAGHPIGLALEVIELAGVEALLDVCSDAAARRMLRYDVDLEGGPDGNFLWLDLTHALTATRAARWAWREHASGDTVRQAFWAAWLVHDAGRQERRVGVPADDAAPAGEPRWLERVDGTPHEEVLKRLVAESLDDRGGSFIVVAHLIKTAVAAFDEAEATGSVLPLAAADRLINSPRRERFVASAVNEAIRFVETGRPPSR